MESEQLLRQYDEIPFATVSFVARRLADQLIAAAVHDADLNRELPPKNTLAWGQKYLGKHFAKRASAMHVWLGKHLDSLHVQRGTKINVIGPRGSAKSTIATLCYVLRAALEGWEPYIWIVSDTIPQAQLHLKNVRAELAENRLLARDYPHSFGLGSICRADAIELANQVVIESVSTGQRIRGRRLRHYRPSLIVCDDLQNDSHISSRLQREESAQWFRGLLLRAGNTRTNIVNLATALHREALALQLHHAPGWISERFAAIRTWPTNMELWQQWETIYANPANANAKRDAQKFYDERRAAMDLGAVVLWEDEEDLYALMQMRVESGAAAFEREKQGSPTDPETCEWPESYFSDEIWFNDWPADLTIRAIALDPSKGSDARRGDYSAFALLGIDPRGVMYVEADLARRPTPQMVADGVALYQRFRPDAFGVEVNQFQELLCGEFKSAFARQGAGHIVPFGVHNNVNKGMRIRRLGTWLSQRKLKFLANSPSTRLLVDQLRDFPNGAHDDGPDALEMALRLVEDIRERRRKSDGLGDRLIFK